MKKVIVLIWGVLCFMGSMTQTIRGIVQDAAGENLSFVNVVLVGTNFSTTSDNSGRFELSGIEPGTYHLQISFVGKTTIKKDIDLSKGDVDLGLLRLSDAQFKTEEVVVTATKTPRLLNSIPATVDLISSKEMASLPSQKIDENLKYVSGVLVDRPFGIFGKSVVSMRGVVSSEPGRQLTLIDGVPINKSDGGGVNWNRIISSDIEHIEIVKGPSSSIYGSNAMGGTINLITKRPNKKALSGAAKAYYGTYNTMGADFNVMQKFGEDNTGFYYSISGKYLKSDGYMTVPDSLRQETDTLVFVQEQAANARLGYRFSDHSLVELEYNFYDDHRGQGSKIRLEDGSTADFDTHFLKLKHESKLGMFSINVNGYMQLEKYLRSAEKLKNEDYTLYNVQSDRLDYGALSSISTHLGVHQISLGLNYRDGSVYGVDDYQTSTDEVINQGKIRHLNVYLQDQIKISQQFKSIAAVQFAYANFYDGSFTLEGATGATSFMDSDTGELSSKSWTGWSPSVSLQYDFTEFTNAYLIGSSGFRAASLDDFTRTGFINIGYKQANPDLTPETINNIELGTRYTQNKTFASANAYYSQGKDFMHYIATGESIFGGRKLVYKKQNISNVEIYGAELNIEQKLLQWLSLSANYSYNHSIIKKFEERQDLEGKLLSYSPEHMANLRAIVNWKKLMTSVNFRWQDKMFLDEDNTFEIEPLMAIDLRLSYEIYKGLGIAVNLQNLLDEQHMVSTDQVSLGRFITYELNYKF